VIGLYGLEAGIRTLDTVVEIGAGIPVRFAPLMLALNLAARADARVHRCASSRDHVFGMPGRWFRCEAPPSASTNEGDLAAKE
jgi:hypothetical protein